MALGWLAPLDQLDSRRDKQNIWFHLCKRWFTLSHPTSVLQKGTASRGTIKNPSKYQNHSGQTGIVWRVLTLRRENKTRAGRAEWETDRSPDRWRLNAALSLIHVTIRKETQDGMNVSGIFNWRGMWSWSGLSGGDPDRGETEQGETCEETRLFTTRTNKGNEITLGMKS